MFIQDDVRQPIPVLSRQGNYSIIVQENLLAQAQFFEPYIAGRAVIVVTHEAIKAHYYPTLLQTLKQANASSVDCLLIPAGDEHKVMASAEKIWQQALTLKMRRDAVFVALGGGMIGDLTGFAASCYLRGIQFIQVPTTLLAQVDAAIGGKTAVNHSMGKNLIGHFYAPAAVLIDPNVLTTLPTREFNAGMAEVIKYAFALDEAFFIWLESAVTQLRTRPEDCIRAIYHSCKIKADIVSQDEFESQNRMLLNFGHTLGHAIESAMNYQGLLHGEAVAIGMVFATYLSCQHNLAAYNVLGRLINILHSIGLPTKFPSQLSVSLVLEKLQQDKKFKQAMQWVLIRAPGDAFISDQVTIEQLEKVLIAWSNLIYKDLD